MKIPIELMYNRQFEQAMLRAFEPCVSTVLKSDKVWLTNTYGLSSPDADVADLASELAEKFARSFVERIDAARIRAGKEMHQ